MIMILLYNENSSLRLTDVVPHRVAVDSRARLLFVADQTSSAIYRMKLGDNKYSHFLTTTGPPLALAVDYDGG